MHPELNFQIASLRHAELTAGSHRHTTVPARPTRRWSLRRRRDTPAGAVAQPASLVLLPPPREERDPKRHDQRVA
jgi:hypothetical protein